MVVHIVDGMCTALSLLFRLSLYDALFYTVGTCEPKVAAGRRDEKVMKRLPIAILLAILIPACHQGPVSEVVVDPPPPSWPPPPSDPGLTEVVFQATNYDYFDYAVWIEWQEPVTRTWRQTFLFSVWGDPIDGPTTNLQIVSADPSVTYYVLLADFWGNLYDSYQLSLPTASSVDVSFNIVDGFLYRTF